MDDVVQEVLTKTRDGELGSVRAPSLSSELSGINRCQSGHEGLRCRLQLLGHHLRILLAVALANGRLVLVPVLEDRVLLGQHLPHAAVEDPEAVSNMSAVLERRPDVRRRSAGHRWAGSENLDPFLSRHKGPLRYLTGIDRPSLQSAVGAAPRQRPGPVLDVRLRFHAARVIALSSPILSTGRWTRCGEVDHFGA